MTPLLPQLPKGFGRKKLIEMLPILFVSNPFFTSLVPFFFFFDNWDPKKIRLSRLVMGFPFYYTRSNDSSPRKIKENLRKLNKKRIDLVEIMSLNVMDEAVLRSPERCPLAVLRLPVHHVLQVRGPVDLTARDCIP